MEGVDIGVLSLPQQTILVYIYNQGLLSLLSITPGYSTENKEGYSSAITHHQSLHHPRLGTTN